jgi:glucose/mannose transport system substrate-binding protein
VRHALRCVQYLSRSFLDDRDKGWAEALAQVQEGSAAFSVMGDWANGELKTALDNGDVDAVPFPGSDKTFVFTSDTFPLPISAPYPVQSMALLDTIASRDAQLAFSREKGSIPARKDVNVAELGARAVSTQTAFAASDVRKVLATSGLFPPYYPDDELSTRLSAMTQPGATVDRVEEVIQLLRDGVPLLGRWQSRLDRGPGAP